MEEVGATRYPCSQRVGPELNLRFLFHRIRDRLLRFQLPLDLFRKLEIFTRFTGLIQR